MTTYSGDNYPGHPHHVSVDPKSTSPLQCLINDLAFVLDRQDEIMNKLSGTRQVQWRQQGRKGRTGLR